MVPKHIKLPFNELLVTSMYIGGFAGSHAKMGHPTPSSTANP